MKVVFSSPILSRSGYGNRSRDIAKALINLNYDVIFTPVSWGSTPNDAIISEDIRSRIIYDNNFDQPDLYIQCALPNEFTPNGKFNIGITAGIESTICNPSWIEGCNRMDLVLVSSNHSKHVLENSKFEKKNDDEILKLELQTPTRVLFEGIDLNTFKCIESENELDIPEQFAFLFVGHWLKGKIGEERKNIGGLIDTFLNTFKRVKPDQKMPALILKTSYAGFNETNYIEIKNQIKTRYKKLRKKGYTGKLPSIYVLRGNMTDEEINNLYNNKKVKAMVSFTRGEGFGRPLLEFTLTGKPVIASDWSGQKDFLNKEYSILLPGNLTQVHPSTVDDWIIPESKWFTVDYNIAAQKMLDCFTKYDSFLEKSKGSIEYTKNNFSLLNMQELLGIFINDKDKFVKEKLILTESPKRIELKLPKNLVMSE